MGGAIVPGRDRHWCFRLRACGAGGVAAPPSPPALTIEVVAHRWWWEVRYDGPTRAQAVTTANEIHIPIGRPVRIQLATHDVIHSVWVPQLAGKTDAVNGQTNVMWLEARTAGIYRGECAEYCGVQHANMSLTVVAEDSTAFAAWLAAQRAPAGPAGEPVTASGAAVFLTARCAACHTVRGSVGTRRRGARPHAPGHARDPGRRPVREYPGESRGVGLECSGAQARDRDAAHPSRGQPAASPPRVPRVAQMSLPS